MYLLLHINHAIGVVDKTFVLSIDFVSSALPPVSGIKVLVSD